MREIFRGWQGHWYITTKWHLNTLLDFGDKKFIISTVGEGYDSMRKDFSTTPGLNDEMFETMVFESDYTEWNDSDVSKQDHDFTRHYKTEIEAQEGHYNIIELVKQKHL
ncbi:MAG: hypothetical protein Q8910_00215 [Bacteroidota bacterium]|nr:hypothetical protein [Bacteroidota bacterium]